MNAGGSSIRIRGIVQAAELVEVDPEAGLIEMVIKAQGVGPNQPRRLVVPHDLLLADLELDPESVQGKGFEALAQENADGRWIVSAIALAGRMLKANDSL